MLPAHRGRVCVFSCNSTARGGTPFPLGRRADAQKGTYWGHINSPEMSPGDISPYETYFANARWDRCSALPPPPPPPLLPPLLLLQLLLQLLLMLLLLMLLRW